MSLAVTSMRFINVDHDVTIDIIFPSIGDNAAILVTEYYELGRLICAKKI